MSRYHVFVKCNDAYTPRCCCGALKDYFGSSGNGWIGWCLLPAIFLKKVRYIGTILLIPTFLDEIDGISYDTFEQRKPGETLKLTAGIAQTRSMIPKQCRNSEVKNAPYEEFFSYFWYHLRAYDRWYHVSTPNIRVGSNIISVSWYHSMIPFLTPLQKSITWYQLIF